MNFEIFIASPPDREKVVAEIRYNNAQLAELSNERGSLDVELYPNPYGGPWQVSFDDFLLALTKAKVRLLNEPMSPG